MNTNIIPIGTAVAPRCGVGQETANELISHGGGEWLWYVDEKTLAQRLSLSERQLRVLRARRLIPFARMGRAIRYRVQDVQQAIERNLTIRARGADQGGAA